jgi:hypothetical protein
MKKIFTVLVALAASFNLLAQPCTPDPALTYPGIMPTKLPNGMVGNPYSEVVSLMVPLDTSLVINGTPVTVRVDSARVIYISSLPKNFTYECDKPTQTWNGGAKGCAKITGTPEIGDDKKHVIWVKTQTWFKVVGLTNQFDQIDSSSIDFTVDAANSVNELKHLPKLVVYPNPVKEELTIALHQYDAAAHFEVYNLLGSKQSIQQQLNWNAGVATIATKELPSGVYFVKGFINGKEFQAKFIKE